MDSENRGRHGIRAIAAAGVLVWANVGGAAGGAVLGLLTQRLGLKGLTLAMLIASGFAVVLFGHGQADLTSLSLICALAGFCTNGGVVGVYAVLARAFPTELGHRYRFCRGCGPRRGGHSRRLSPGFCFRPALACNWSPS